MLDKGKAATGTPLRRLQSELESNPGAKDIAVMIGDVADVYRWLGYADSEIAKEFSGKRPGQIVRVPIDELGELVELALAGAAPIEPTL